MLEAADRWVHDEARRKAIVKAVKRISNNYDGSVSVDDFFNTCDGDLI